MDVATERPVKAQLTTARLLLAQFIAQLDEYAAMNREARRTPRGRDLSARLGGLKDGREKWAAKVDELEARLATEVSE
ncbi:MULTISPECIES: hypothetical protein [unclassified Microbacterium]|uniref:hypothetical protein n=1 Tax=unclassified Microbacterium TaxID=2609290 RepID=UPI0011BD91D5|nr:MULTISPECIES: hypothetical protein [unclassified Microbacterium]NYF29025.1 hypothetical protein [Microbacterium sp. JAI119]